ncbi:hypothetical protein [Rossellomorea marisflavi]|uniref:hypothetical protein n=1 Tax=Rossellomorea marisflavi TaxID=189381 RepID=UPI003FA08D93
MVTAVPLDKCKWCKGTGDDGGGYSFCPDCEGSGYKHGKQAETYSQYLTDIICDWHITLLDILREEFEFKHDIFIGKKTENFVMSYFTPENLETIHPPREVLAKLLLDELGDASFFDDSRICYGQILQNKKILVYIGKDNKPSYFPPEEYNGLIIELDSESKASVDFIIGRENYVNFIEAVTPTFLCDSIFMFNSKECDGEYLSSLIDDYWLI